MNNKKPSLTDRRKAIKKITLSAAAMLSAPFIWTSARGSSTQKKIVVRDSGGFYTEAFRKIFYAPFTAKTGIEVVSVTSPPEPTAEIRMMVESKRPLWDIAALSHRAVQTLTAGEVFLERHGLGQDAVVLSIPAQFMSSYGVGSNVYSTVLAYRTDKFKGRPAPKSWQDFWDVKNYPGRRSLRKHPFDTIEVALMASGVPAAKVYPCDLDKAFKSLDKIKSDIAVWWMYGAQTEQLLKNDEIDLILIWTGRVQEAINAGVPVEVVWDQHIYKCESWAILKGTPNLEACREFIKFVSEPKQQALLAPLGVGPVQSEAFKYIDLEQGKLLPTHPDNLKKGICTDATYWLKAQKEAIERFNHWMLT